MNYLFTDNIFIFIDKTENNKNNFLEYIAFLL